MLVRLLREKYPASVFVDAGGFLSPRRDEQDLLKNEAVIKIYALAGFDALNVGGPELSNAALTAASATPLPLVSCNAVGEPGAPHATPYALIQCGGLTVGIVGVVDCDISAEDKNRVRDAGPALREAAVELADRADVVICLAHVKGGDRLRELARDNNDAIDVVIAGGRLDSVLVPENVSGCWVAPVRPWNRYVGVLNLSLNADGRVVAAENEYVPVTDAMPLDNAVQAQVETYRAAVRSWVEAADFFTPGDKIPPGGFIYVGSNRCAQCHKSQAEDWRATSHATAFATLESGGRAYDPECVSCHTTGMGYRGGFAGKPRTPEHAAVSCEACHGPGEGHLSSSALSPAAITPDTCVGCHDEATSPNFDFESYRDRVVH